MNVVPFEYLVAREARSRRFEVLRCLPCDSWPSHEAGGRFFFEEEAVRTASGPRPPSSRDSVRIGSLKDQRPPSAVSDGHESYQ